MKTVSMLLVGLLASIGAARAQTVPEWVYAAESVSGEKYSIDAASLRVVADEVVDAWVQTVLPEPHTDEFDDTYDREVRLYRIYCTTRQLSTLSLTQYLGQDVVWTATYGPGETEAAYATPGSVSAAVVTLACIAAGYEGV